MSLAMDCPWRAAARPLWIGVLLAVSGADLGCSAMSSAHPDAPRFGGLGRIRRIRMQGPVLSADRPRDGIPPPPSPPVVAPAAPVPQAIVRSTAPPPGAILPPPGAPARPVAVAQQPPAPAVEAPREAPPPPADPAAPRARDGLEEIVALVASGRAKLEQIATYQVRLTRQERVGEELQPAEDVLLSIRRQPRAVRLEWPDGPHKGREVLYSATEHDGLMHIKMANPLVPVPPLALPPDSPLALRTSRHPISEAGLDGILDKLETSIKLFRQGDAETGVVTDGGPETPEALGRPCRKVVRKKPDGETWVVCLDAETGLPVLVQATAADGSLLEKYRFRDLRADPPELASAAAFDPSQRWGSSNGFLNRLARAAATAADAPKPPAAAPSP